MQIIFAKSYLKNVFKHGHPNTKGTRHMKNTKRALIYYTKHIFNVMFKQDDMRQLKYNPHTLFYRDRKASYQMHLYTQQFLSSCLRD